MACLDAVVCRKHPRFLYENYVSERKLAKDTAGVASHQPAGQIVFTLPHFVAVCITGGHYSNALIDR
jgi:hypothetical protein